MSKISCTDYSSKICTELNWNEPNLIFYFISFTLVVIHMYWYCVLCIAAFWQLLIINDDDDDEIAYFTVRWKIRDSFVYRTKNTR